MTTTVVIALAAAAALLVTLLIVLAVCKRESKKRTESINAIENRLKEVTKVLADSNRIKNDTVERSFGSGMEELIQAIEKLAAKNVSEEKAVRYDTEYEQPEDEISLDFLEAGDLYDIQMDDLEDFEEDDLLIGTEYNTGRSGKKYTAEELETLIKE